MKNVLLINRCFKETPTLNEYEFIDELARNCNLSLFGEECELNRTNTDLFQYVLDNNFDAVICTYNTKHFDLFLKLSHPNKILITADIHKYKWAKSASHIRQFKKQYDVKQILCRALNANFAQSNSKLFAWSLDENTWKYNEDDKIYDVCLIGNPSIRIYPLRAAFLRRIKYTKYKYISGVRDRKGKYLKNYAGSSIVGEKYVKKIQKSKVFLFDSSVYKYPVKKYFEAMACGALIMADKPMNAEEIGLIDGENYIEVTKFNWESKLRKIIHKDSERLRTTQNARKLFEKKHTNKIRVLELLEKINES